MGNSKSRINFKALGFSLLSGIVLLGLIGLVSSTQGIIVKDAVAATTSTTTTVPGTTVPPAISTLLSFDQLSTNFIKTGVQAIIPIGLTSTNLSSKMQIISVAGLPAKDPTAGPDVQFVTDPVNLGQTAAVNIVWTPFAGQVGTYTCQVSAKDNTTGITTNTSFNIVVSSTAPTNESPTLSALGTQRVAKGGKLLLPVTASREIGSNNLKITASGLPGTIDHQNSSASKLDAKATLSWTAPTAAGKYLLGIEAYEVDAMGNKVGTVRTFAQVPIIVE